MKYKSKIITCAFISFFMMFLLNNVIAVGSVYQAVYKYDTPISNPYIIYRTVVKPLQATLASEDFNVGFNNWSTGTNTEKATVSWSGYKSNYLVFTIGMIGSYEELDKATPDTAGYSQFNFEGAEKLSTMSFLDTEADAFKLLVDGTTFVSNVFVADAEGRELYKYSDKRLESSNDYYVPHITEAFFTGEALYKYKENMIKVSNDEDYHKGFKVIMNNTKKELKNFPAAASSSDTFNLEKSVKMTIEQKMLYTTDEEKVGKRPCESSNANVYYVMDIKLNEEITKNLKDYKIEEGGETNPFVSGISVTAAGSTKGSDIITLLTPGAWLRSKVRKLSPSSGWSDGTTRAYDYGYGER